MSEESPLSADGVTDVQVEDYGIAPEDADLANEISNFDPVYDTPSPVSLVGNVKLPEMKIDALPPAMRDPILAKLGVTTGTERERLETELVREALYDNSLNTRIQAGLGEHANPYVREVFNITNEARLLEQEFYRIQIDLADIVRWDNVEDAETGQPKPVAVERVQGERRRGMQLRAKEIEHQIAQLRGIEGQRRKQRALRAAIQERKQLAEQVEDHQEVDARAKKIEREDRIQARAEQRAKMLSAGRP